MDRVTIHAVHDLILITMQYLVETKIHTKIDCFELLVSFQINFSNQNNQVNLMHANYQNNKKEDIFTYTKSCY
jgi:hypothetical protein